MAITFDNFTIKAQECILQGQKIAKANEQQMVDTAHLIKGILETDESIAEFLLKKMDVIIPVLEKELDKEISTLPKMANADKQYLTDTANQAMSNAKGLLKEYGDDYISIETMLAGILNGKDKGAKILKDLGATEKGLKAAINDLRKGRKVVDQHTENTYNALSKFGINLNARAESGELDPIVGRDEEIRRLLHILSRRKKNNPLLIGEPGVGKTAIIEGIAWRIVKQDVPENLKTKRIYTLDISSLVAGAKYKGEFEERLKGVIKEVTSSNGEIILFIDEIHSLVGTGGGGGAMDAANILKPALARGELRTIGATTLDEYQKYFEKDKALVRRFQTVLIEEPSVQDTISILRGLQERYEVYHKVEILDEALIAAAELSSRYIPDRQLPDKAIDLIDEAAAKMRLELDSVPGVVDEWNRKVIQLEIEREAIKREKDQKKLEVINGQISNAKEKRDSLRAAWQNEKEIVDTIQNLKKEIEELEQEADKAERDSDFEGVAKIRYGQIKDNEVMLKVAHEKLNALPEDQRFTNEEVTADDIADIVARWTGIPVTKMMQSEKDKLLKLEDQIGKRLIGQKEAVVAVSDAVRRSRAGLQDGNRPIGSFIFLGPTGVGKTELAKALAEVLFDDENAITRIDMSEYMEQHSVSKLVGAPPGYVGYDEGGQLTEAVRRKPYSIILLDEIEKAHPDTFNILLQVLDDGRLTDSRGRVADFKNTIIIMTSNMGAMTILENFEDLDALGEKHRDEILEATKKEVFDQLKESLRPEFINRIDEQIMFLPLTKKEIKKILVILLKKVHKMLGKQGIKMEINNDAMNLLADLGYDPQFGARPMKRVLQKEIINEVSKLLLAGDYTDGDTLYVGTKGKKLAFGKKPFADKTPAGSVSDKTSPKEDAHGSTPTKDAKAEERQKQLEALQKATKDVEDAVGNLPNHAKHKKDDDKPD